MEKAKQPELLIGGQAVIEGVMMRGPEYLATAIRRKDGAIEIKREYFLSITKRIKWLGAPFIRGAVSLFEVMRIGYGTLNFSAQRAMLDEDEGKERAPWVNKLEEWAMFAIALVAAFALFVYGPYRLADWLDLGRENFYFNLLAGFLRIVVFVLYVWLIHFMKDVQRLFAYHGAEHKTVHAYEQKKELVPLEVQKFSTLHQRCGTSFMFFVLLIAILFFSLIDMVVMVYWGKPVLGVRIFYHLLLLPVIGGISYELLRFSGKKTDHPLVQLLIFPGMALQRITTQPPDDSQVEIAIVALRAAIGDELTDYPGVRWLNN